MGPSGQNTKPVVCTCASPTGAGLCDVFSIACKSATGAKVVGCSGKVAVCDLPATIGATAAGCDNACTSAGYKAGTSSGVVVALPYSCNCAGKAGSCGKFSEICKSFGGIADSCTPTSAVCKSEGVINPNACTGVCTAVGYTSGINKVSTVPSSPSGPSSPSPSSFGATPFVCRCGSTDKKGDCNVLSATCKRATGKMGLVCTTSGGVCTIPAEASATAVDCNNACTNAGYTGSSSVAGGSSPSPPSSPPPPLRKCLYLHWFCWNLPGLYQCMHE